MSKDFLPLLTKSEKKTITEKGSQQIKDLFNKYHDKLNKILSDYDKYMYYKFRVREFGKNDFQETNKIFWKDINHLDDEENPYLLVFKHLDTQKKKSFIFSKEEYSVEVNHITFKKILYDKTLTKDEIDFYDFIDNYTKEMIWGFHDEDGWGLLKKLKSELNTLLKSLSKKHITDFDKRLTKLSTKKKNTKKNNSLWSSLSEKEQKLIEDKGENKFKLIYSKYEELLDNYFQKNFGDRLYMSNDNFGINGEFKVREWDSHEEKYKWEETELLDTKLYLRSQELGFYVPIGEETSKSFFSNYTIYKVDLLIVYFPTSYRYYSEKYLKNRLCFFDFLKKYKKEGDVWGYNKVGFKILFKLRDELESLIKELKKKYIDDVKKEKIEVEKEVKSLVKSEFDLDENGELDIIEGENIVMDLIQKNQKEIGEFDHKIIQNLVKLNNFLNVKKENLTKLFNVLKKVETQKNLKKVIDSLKMSIENYQLLLVHSINMIVSIKTKEYVTYYELYENFDKMGVFNSEFENQLSKKLNKLSGKLSSIISSLDTVNSSIIRNEKTTRSSLQQLSYVTSSSFKSLQSSVTKELSSIRDGVGLNNLLTGINTYQLYTLNQNTKSLRG